MTTTADRPGLADPLLPPAGRRRRRFALVAALVVVVAVFLTWLVAFSPVFGVRHLEVHGLRTLDRSAVETAAEIDYGQPVVRVDTAAITERVETLPQVESAEVSTSFPATIVITVTERTPVGYVIVAGRKMLVDRSGRQYLGVDSAPDLPRLELPDGSGAAGARVSSAVATVAAALPAALRAKTRSVEALAPDVVTVVLAGRSGDVLVQWGSAAQSAAKAAVVAVLAARKGVERIDVTNPARPFTD